MMYKRQEITTIKENMKFMALNNLCSQKNPYLCSILTEFLTTLYLMNVW